MTVTNESVIEANANVCFWKISLGLQGKENVCVCTNNHIRFNTAIIVSLRDGWQGGVIDQKADINAIWKSSVI